MLRASKGLSESDLSAVAALQERVVAADGGRLKLEWQTLWSRPADAVNDFVWFDGDRLVGFLGIYSFGGMTPELAGMVDPAARRQGIGGALLDAARNELLGRGAHEALLVCPRTSAGGAAFAHARGAVADHSEHALVLHGAPTPGPSDPATSLRAATVADAAEVRRQLHDGFGYDDDGVAARLAEDDEQNIVIERDGAVVGYVRLTLADGDRGTGATGGVYGFVVDAALRGRGIGRDVLRRCCLRLQDQGAQSVGLEVFTDNEHALGLYTSLGFEPVITEDYFRLRFEGAA